MEWAKLLDSTRIGDAPSVEESVGFRSPFQSDVDRIVFSSAFRRLAKKTQVHPFCDNDHVHTRLTHSIEVSQLGRSLGLGLVERLAQEGELAADRGTDVAAVVQAACLAHDLGNPPFGHAGEEAISHWFGSSGADYIKGLKRQYRDDVARFEGNAQGLRIIAQTENHLFEGGLRLTAATLGAFIKYPWVSSATGDRKKFGAFLTEAAVLEHVAERTGLVPSRCAEGEWCRHPLAYLTEAADDICYAITDIEDAVELGVLKFSEAQELLLACLPKDQRDVVKAEFPDDRQHRVNFARIRSPLFAKLISDCLDCFMDQYADIMAGTAGKSLFDMMDAANSSRVLIGQAKQVGLDTIYKERFKSFVEMGCTATLDTLLNAFCTAAIEQVGHLSSDECELTWRTQVVARQMGNHSPRHDNSPNGGSWSEYPALRRALDYVSGATDDYALSLAKGLRGEVPRR